MAEATLTDVVVVGGGGTGLAAASEVARELHGHDERPCDKAEFGGVSESHSHFGWTIGAGAEVGLTPNWSAKVEYLFVNLADERYALTGLDHDFANSLLRFGFNFRF